MLRFQCQQEMRKQFSSRNHAATCCCRVIVLHVESQDCYLQPYQRPGGASEVCPSESFAIAFVSLQPDPHMLQFPHPDRSRNSLHHEIVDGGCHPALHAKLKNCVSRMSIPSRLHRIEGNSSVLAYSEYCRAPNNKDQCGQSPMYTPTRRLANQRFKTLANGQITHTPIQPSSTMAQLAHRTPKRISARG